MKKTARIAGLFYFLQIPLGVFGIMYLPKVLLQEGSGSQTFANILAHEQIVRWSLLSAIVCAMVTVVTAYYLFKLFKPVSVFYAKMILLFTLVVLPISLLNELNHAAVLLLLKNTSLHAAFSQPQLESLVSFFLDLHRYGLQMVNIFFGLWLLPMAILVIRSGYVPKLIGYFLALTCGGYLLDVVLFFLCPEFGLVISEYTWMGEVMMVLWLLMKGINQAEFEKRYGTVATN